MPKLLDKTLSMFKATTEISSDAQASVVVVRAAKKKFLDEAMNASDSRKAPYALQYIKEVGVTDIDDCGGDSILSIYNYGRQFFESCSVKNGTDLKLRETLYPLFIKFEWAYEAKSYGNPISAIRQWSEKDYFDLGDERAQELLGESFEAMERIYLSGLDFSQTQKNCSFKGFFECLQRRAELSNNSEERISIAEVFLKGLDLIDESGLHFCYKSAIRMFDLGDAITIFDDEQLARYSELLSQLKSHYEEQPSFQHHRFPEFMEKIQAIGEQYKNDAAWQINTDESEEKHALKIEILAHSWALPKNFDEDTLIKKYESKAKNTKSAEEKSVVDDEFKLLKKIALQTA